MNAFILGQDKTMCTFSAYVIYDNAFYNATNGHNSSCFLQGYTILYVYKIDTTKVLQHELFFLRIVFYLQRLV